MTEATKTVSTETSKVKDEDLLYELIDASGAEDFNGSLKEAYDMPKAETGKIYFNSDTAFMDTMDTYKASGA